MLCFKYICNYTFIQKIFKYINFKVRLHRMDLASALVKLRHVKAFKKCLGRNITGVHLETEQCHKRILGYVRARYFG